MPKQRKAARGKHRWIGIEIELASLGRKEVQNELSKILPTIEFRLFDCKSSSESTLAIIKVGLADYQFARDSIESASGIESRTSSGKIRLVRERLNLPRPVRKR